MKRPAFQFYPGDWLHNPELRTCSLVARGLWIDMLCYMHQGTPYGHLKIGEKVILPPTLARMTGATIEEVEGALAELEEAQVFSRDESGCIFSRRMIRDEEIRQSRAAGGVLGGNPELKNKRKVKDKPPERLTSEDNQNPTPSSSSSSSSSEKPNEEVEAEDAAKDKFFAYVKHHFPHWSLSGDKWRAFLDQWEPRFPWSVILMAAEECMASGVNRLSYFDGILIDWNENNARTPEEVQAHQARKKMAREYAGRGETGRTERKPSARSPVTTASGYQPVNPDDLYPPK